MADCAQRTSCLLTNRTFIKILLVAMACTATTGNVTFPRCQHYGHATQWHHRWRLLSSPNDEEMAGKLRPAAPEVLWGFVVPIMNWMWPIQQLLWQPYKLVHQRQWLAFHGLEGEISRNGYVIIVLDTKQLWVQLIWISVQWHDTHSNNLFSFL